MSAPFGNPEAPVPGNAPIIGELVDPPSLYQIGDRLGGVEIAVGGLDTRVGELTDAAHLTGGIALLGAGAASRAEAAALRAAQGVDTLGTTVHTMDHRLTTGMAGLGTRLETRIDRVGASLGARIDGVDASVGVVGDRVDAVGDRVDDVHRLATTGFDRVEASVDAVGDRVGAVHGDVWTLGSGLGRIARHLGVDLDPGSGPPPPKILGKSPPNLGGRWRRVMADNRHGWGERWGNVAPSGERKPNSRSSGYLFASPRAAYNGPDTFNYSNTGAARRHNAELQGAHDYRVAVRGEPVRQWRHVEAHEVTGYRIGRGGVREAIFNANRTRRRTHLRR